MLGISYQLYCSRNFPPLEDTLAMLAAAGYKDVEGFGGLYADPAGFKAALDKAGLRMPTGHFGLAQVEGDRDKMLGMAKSLNMDAVIVPYVMPDDRPSTAEGWRAFGKRLNEAGKPFLDAGIKFGWHNHDFEFVAVDGVLPEDAILDGGPDLSVELDVGWVKVAGLDLVQTINKYKGRLIAAHIKDIAPDGECADESGWADVGHGVIDWKPVHAALQAAGVNRYVVEHDNPNDHKRFAIRSLAAVKAF